jgi:hypothetical protein
MRAARSVPVFALIAVIATSIASSARAGDPLDVLVASYPDALVRHDDRALLWRDGTAMPVSDGVANKAFEMLLRYASILDQFSVPYRRGPLSKPPGPNEDPGRFRNTAFFRKMYGDCDKGEVSSRLVSIPWLAKTWGKPVRITPVNHLDERLRAVSAEIDVLPDNIKRAAYPIAGTYNCRVVADTRQPSPHAFGIAIDLNLAFSDYWYWARTRDGSLPYRNRMPQEIVSIFEKHGFIWGGKWNHFDTMHFEYRPELLADGP